MVSTADGTARAALPTSRQLLCMAAGLPASAATAGGSATGELAGSGAESGCQTQPYPCGDISEIPEHLLLDVLSKRMGHGRGVSAGRVTSIRTLAVAARAAELLQSGCDAVPKSSCPARYRDASLGSWLVT